MAEVPLEEEVFADQDGEPEVGGEGGEDELLDPVPQTRDDTEVFIFILCVAVLVGLLYVFWQKKGKQLWRKFTGAEKLELGLGLYELTHTTREDETYRVEVVLEDGFFQVVLDPPVIEDFDEQYNQALDAGHLEEEHTKDDEAVEARSKLWKLLKTRTAVTFELAQRTNTDKAGIDVAYNSNCITEKKYKSFKAAQDYFNKQFEEIQACAETLRPGSKDKFIKQVVQETKNRQEFAKQRAELEKLRKIHLRADEETLEVSVPFLPDNIPRHKFKYTIPKSKSPGDEVELTVPLGNKVTVTIPEDKKAGDDIFIAVPFMFMDPDFAEKRLATLKLQEDIFEKSDGEEKPFAVTIPDGKKPGDEVSFPLPAGMVYTLRVPPGKGPGDTINCNVPAAALIPRPGGSPRHGPGGGAPRQEMANFPFVVPEGAKEGDQIDVPLPSGMGIKVTIPPGKKPGDVLQLQLPKAALVQQDLVQHKFNVPAGKKGGDEIELKLPSGMMLKVTLPPGKKEGDEVSVRVPRRAVHKQEVGDFTFDIPEGKKEGDECEIKLPAGMPLRVKIPPGKKGGDKMTIQVPKQALAVWGEHKFKVPEGKKAGDIVEVKLPSGAAINVKIGVGKKAGDEVSIRVPKEALVEHGEVRVTVPPGAKPGDDIPVTLPSGLQIKAKVPEGKKEGDEIALRVPKQHLESDTGIFTYKVPPGAKPGDDVPLTLPSGMRINAKVPPGASEGTEVPLRVPKQHLQEQKMVDFPFKVPPGKSAGDDVEIRLPSGMPLRVKIPPGKSAGDMVSVRVPEQHAAVGEFALKVPPGKKAGDEVEATLPSGMPIRVKVPEGKSEGDEIKIRVPKHALEPADMVDFTFTVPEGKSGGDEAEIELPNGIPIKVRIPEGKSAGDSATTAVPKRALAAPPMAKFPFKVPEGKKPGDTVDVTLPSGMQIRVKIPEGKKAGDVIELRVPKQALAKAPAPSGAGPQVGGFPPGTPTVAMPYKVPPNKSPGDVLDIRLPSGVQINVKVPADKKPGDSMEIKVPAPLMDPQFQQKRRQAMMAQMNPQQKQQFMQREQMMASMNPQQRQAFIMHERHKRFEQLNPAQKQQALGQMPPQARQHFMQQHAAFLQFMQRQQAQAASSSPQPQAKPVTPARSEAVLQAEEQKKKAALADQMAAQLLAEEEDEKSKAKQRGSAKKGKKNKKGKGSPVAESKKDQ